MVECPECHKRCKNEFGFTVHWGLMHEGERPEDIYSAPNHPGFLSEVTLDSIIADIRSIAEELGRTPTAREFSINVDYVVDTAENRFDKRWPEICRQADLPPPPDLRGYRQSRYVGLGETFVSKSERNVAGYFETVGLNWKRAYLPDDTLQTPFGGYTPDFILNEVNLVEVGYYSLKQAEKLQWLIDDGWNVLVISNSTDCRRIPHTLAVEYGSDMEIPLSTTP